MHTNQRSDKSKYKATNYLSCGKITQLLRDSMFNKTWLTIISSFFIYIMFLPSSESAALLRWLCTFINITLLCNEATEAAVVAATGDGGALKL
uniref:Uncharacterized protein n=1 Tax=Trichobilharzia regenti TaxID=157069 RepID=A0AA85IYA7_TRIRE|nr:unnamed protein product [Trichobilharzia regenti]